MLKLTLPWNCPYIYIYIQYIHIHIYIYSTVQKSLSPLLKYNVYNIMSSMFFVFCISVSLEKGKFEISKH